jgi:imidazolonepropionase-like amidohydrolase
MTIYQHPSISPGARVKLINGQFADVIAGEYFPAGTSLILQDSKIVAMPCSQGELDTASVDDTPADAVIDLQGKYVVPGLFNTHAHLQIIAGLVDKGEIRQRQIAKNLSDCLERGVTNIRDALCWDLRQNRSLSEQISRGELLAPRIRQAVHVSPLGGTYAPRQTILNRVLFSMLAMPTLSYKSPDSGVVTFRRNASVKEVRGAVDQAIDERGAETIKFCDQPEHFMSYKPGASVMTAVQLEAAVDQACKRGIPTTIHNVTVDGFRQSLQAGVSSLAHIPFDQELADADLKLFSDAETFVEPTLTVGYYLSWRMKGNTWRDDPEIERLDVWRDSSYQTIVEESWLPEVQKNYAAQPEALKEGTMKIFGLFEMSQPFHYHASLIPLGGKNFQRIYEAGGRERSGCGNDATVSSCSQAAIHLEMDMFDFILNRNEKRVFDGKDALRIATIQSARATGLDRQFGSIETGKIADLVVLDGDPFEDFHWVGSPVAALFLDGKLVINHCRLEVEPSGKAQGYQDHQSQSI